MVDCIARIFCVHDQLKTDKKTDTETIRVEKGANKSDEDMHRKHHYGMHVIVDNSSREQATDVHDYNELTDCVEPETTNMPTSLSGHFETEMSSDVKEIKACLKKMLDRVDDKEAKEVIVREWRIVALGLDRLFFFLYIFFIVISIGVFFKN